MQAADLQIHTIKKMVYLRTRLWQIIPGII